MEYGQHVGRLVEALSALPGIGRRLAVRLAFHIIAMTPEEANGLAAAITNAKEKVKYCSVCCNLTDGDICPLCESGKRDKSTVMVVENPRDLAAYEQTGEFRGQYHVLNGAISPMNGITPEMLTIKELLHRLDGGVTEVILATNPNVEGEATAMYLSRLIKPLGVKTTRIAHGVPVGGDLEFVDQVTLTKALDGRREM